MFKWLQNFVDKEIVVLVEQNKKLQTDVEKLIKIVFEQNARFMLKDSYTRHLEALVKEMEEERSR